LKLLAGTGTLERDEEEPLISFGGKTTPSGAFISSRAARASPLVAEGAMYGEDFESMADNCCTTVQYLKLKLIGENQRQPIECKAVRVRLANKSTSASSVRYVPF
jgi:hypothetical protein